MRRQARVPTNILNEGRINTRITPEGLDLLMEEVNKRSRLAPQVCTMGTVLDEIIKKHLSHAPEVREAEPEPIPEPKPVQPVAMKRGPGRPRKLPTSSEARTA